MLYRLYRLFENTKAKIEQSARLDISLLVILLVVVQHSFLIKIFGLLLTLVINARTLRSVKLSKIPLFYTIIPSIEVLKFFLLDPDFSQGRMVQFVIGILYWLGNLMVCWVLFARVQENEDQVNDRSLKLFAFLNFAFSFSQIVRICLIEGVFNPYNTHHDHPFGISSGDMILGIFHGVHLTNAFVSILLVFYFASRKNYLFLFLCLFSFLLCGSNYASIVLLCCLGVYFLVSRNKAYTFKISFVIFLCVVGFYAFITPVNAEYAMTKIMTIVGKTPIIDEQYLAGEDKKKFEKPRKFTPDTIRTYPLFYFDPLELDKGRPVVLMQPVYRLNIRQYDFINAPGKKTAFEQTFRMMKSSPKYMLFGAGMGKFSSALAFNFSGITDHMLFIKHFPHYESDLFRNNHKSIYDFMKHSHMIFHSESNIPFSTYNQFLGEYGIVGIFIFMFLYLGYFIRRMDRRSYAVPVLLLMLFAINLNYFFESIDFIVVFELLMFLNIKATQRSAREGMAAATVLPV